MKITISDYLIEAALRHYEALAKAYRYDGDNKACNAARIASKEIIRIKKIIQQHKKDVTSQNIGVATQGKIKKD